MITIQDAISKAISIKGSEILLDKRILCNTLEDLSPDLYESIAFINRIITDAVGELLYKSYLVEKSQRDNFMIEIDRILEEEEDRGAKSRSTFLSYFELSIKKKDNYSRASKISVSEKSDQILLKEDQNSIMNKNAGNGEYTIQNNSDGSVTKGFKKNGIWDGEFTKIFQSGAYYIGTHVNGKVLGKLTYVNEKGLKKIGIWKDGNWNGECRVEHDDNSETIGIMENGAWNGPFTKTYKSGVVYKGTCVNGETVGMLSRTDEEGNEFVCNWHDGNWNGDGVYHSEQGILSGYWENGELVGEGIYKYRNGRVYKGEIKNFLKDGKGTILFPPGDSVLTAQFKEDKVVGSATILFTGGDKYVGTWRDIIDGYGTFESNQCAGIKSITYSGGWKDGLISGNSCKLRMVPYRGSTILYEGDFSLGKAEGNGFLYEIDSNGFKEPIINGKWKDNTLVSKSKSRIVITSEGLIENAVDYIRRVTVKVTKILLASDSPFDATPINLIKDPTRKTYPNDPCPCGSGKKYKSCHGQKKTRI